MTIEKAGYRSYLLRLWCVKKNGGDTWRASLENPRTGQQQLFSDLKTLNEFLENVGKILEGEVEEIYNKTQS